MELLSSSLQHDLYFAGYKASTLIKERIDFSAEFWDDQNNKLDFADFKHIKKIILQVDCEQNL